MPRETTTAGCPSAERKALTEPTGGASPVLAPAGVDSLLAQLRHQGRAVPLRRRRKVRDEILGREGKPSQSPLRKARRQTLYTCLVQPQVDARIPNESLAPVSRASSATSFTENWIHSVPSGVRPLDFRDHIPVRPASVPTAVASCRGDSIFSRRRWDGVRWCISVSQNPSRASGGAWGSPSSWSGIILFFLNRFFFC